MKYIKLYEEYNEDENTSVEDVDIFDKDDDSDTSDYYIDKFKVNTKPPIIDPDKGEDPSDS